MLRKILTLSLFCALCTFLVFASGNLFKPRRSSVKYIIPQELKQYSVATFAGGCFWCMEEPFDRIVGVEAAISGYSGGTEVDPDYEDVAYGLTSHREAVQIYYNSKKISYQELLTIFWAQIDPEDSLGQFADKGHHYTTAIYYHDKSQQQLAETSRNDLSKSKKFSKDIQTKIEKFTNFYPAENYHQNYYRKKPKHYLAYKKGSGRSTYIEDTWPSVIFKARRPSTAALKDQLSEMEFQVTQQSGTEPPFQNQYYDLKEEGIYVDIVNGAPLFSSLHKYDSGSGWPAFYQSLNDEDLTFVTDTKHGMQRVEVRSKTADSHLGHVFDDGPKPTMKRFCINSASLKFIPKDELKNYNLERFLSDFK